jgi:hypothetical protein
VYGDSALYGDNDLAAPGTGINWHYYLNNKGYTYWAIQTASTPGGVVTPTVEIWCRQLLHVGGVRTHLFLVGIEEATRRRL